MARAYRRLTVADEDEIWERLRTGHAAKPTARAFGTFDQHGCGPICCDVAASDPSRGSGHRVG